MPWIYLLVAGTFEVGFTTCLKLSCGLTKLWPTVGFLVLSTVSFGLLTLATRNDRIALGTAYAVWTGIGAFGTALVGIAFFKDSMSPWRMVFLATLIGSIVGLKLVSPDE